MRKYDFVDIDIESTGFNRSDKFYIIFDWAVDNIGWGQYILKYNPKTLSWTEDSEDMSVDFCKQLILTYLKNNLPKRNNLNFKYNVVSIWADPLVIDKQYGWVKIPIQYNDQFIGLGHLIFTYDIKTNTWDVNNKDLSNDFCLAVVSKLLDK